MELDELQRMGDADLPIDRDKLDESAGSVPYKISKWLKFLNNEKLSHVILTDEYNNVYRRQYGHYKLKIQQKLDKREILDIYLPGDSDLQEVSKRLKYCEQKMHYIEGVIKALGNINFNITNMIKWQEFQHGR